MDYLKLSNGLGTTYERCTICNWYELDPYNVAPHHRMVEDGVCHVCLTACRGAQFVPSAALPDPFEGSLGGGVTQEQVDSTLEHAFKPSRMPVQADPGGGVVVSPLCNHCGLPIALRNPSGKCDHLYWPDYLTHEAKVANGLEVYINQSPPPVPGLFVK